MQGAEHSTHFLTYASTLVKDRDDKLFRRLTAVLISSDADGVEVVPMEVHNCPAQLSLVKKFTLRNGGFFKGIV